MNGRSLDLTFKEFELLKFLTQQPGRVFTRAQLLQEVWGYDYFGGTRTVDVHVRRLRAKLGAENESLIGTVRNVGYRFVPAKGGGRGRRRRRRSAGAGRRRRRRPGGRRDRRESGRGRLRRPGPPHAPPGPRADRQAPCPHLVPRRPAARTAGVQVRAGR